MTQDKKTNPGACPCMWHSDHVGRNFRIHQSSAELLSACRSALYQSSTGIYCPAALLSPSSETEESETGICICMCTFFRSSCSRNNADPA